MSTAIVRQDLTLDKLQTIQAFAPIAKASQLFGVVKEEQAVAIMVKGWELGFSLSSSFEFITVIQGKPVLSPKGMMALIMNSPEYESHKIIEKPDAKGNPYSCTVTMKRKNRFEFTATFTIDDAKRAGLVKDGGAWTTYPANMLRWRTLGYCADQVFPDIIGGLKRADEFNSIITPDGEIIEGSWEHVPTQTPPKPSVPDHSARLQTLIDQYGPTAVMAANNDMIPGTAAEIDAVAAKLAEQAE